MCGLFQMMSKHLSGMLHLSRAMKQNQGDAGNRSGMDADPGNSWGRNQNKGQNKKQGKLDDTGNSLVLDHICFSVKMLMMVSV